MYRTIQFFQACAIVSSRPFSAGAPSRPCLQLRKIPVELPTIDSGRFPSSGKTRHFEQIQFYRPHPARTRIISVKRRAQTPLPGTAVVVSSPAHASSFSYRTVRFVLPCLRDEEYYERQQYERSNRTRQVRKQKGVPQEALTREAVTLCR